MYCSWVVAFLFITDLTLLVARQVVCIVLVVRCLLACCPTARDLHRNTKPAVLQLQKRVATAREDWQKDQTQLTQAEIDRALTTAREAWAANHQDELEEQLIKATERVRKDMKERMANEKQQLAESVRKLAAKQFEKEKLHFENELQESKASESSPS